MLLRSYAHLANAFIAQSTIIVSTGSHASEELHAYCTLDMLVTTQNYYCIQLLYKLHAVVTFS